MAKVTSLTPATLRSQINSHYKKQVVYQASDKRFEITRIPTGVLSVDYVMNGGFPRGRHIEIYGQFSAGKTALSLLLCAMAQQLGGRAGFVDAENTFDPVFAKHLGVNLKELDLEPQEEHGQQLIDTMDVMLRSGLYDVLVLDSIAALLPKAERETESSQASMGTYQARLMSAALRKLTAANRNTVLVYINQMRESVGQMFGPKMTTSGGRAMGFYAGTRLELVIVENLKVNQKVIDPKTDKEVTKPVIKGHRVLMKVTKDKTGAQPFDETTFVFDYTTSKIDPIEDLIYLGRRLGFISISGDTWWIIGHEDAKQHGRTRFKSYLKRNPEIADDLEDAIRNFEGE